MKKVSIIIGLLGFFTLSCATTTANTDQRKVLSIQEHGTKVSADKKETCLMRCESEGISSQTCYNECTAWNEFTPKVKKLILAGFLDCKNACMRHGYDEDSCRNACK